eukprot:Gregarina_sp_Poly_1__2581@NODE_16_length_22882_cov_82_653956_g14_i0_p6_GENE_NODE_16_length_22882_cov_82_653956_g14_i0NODE_16_length_22882_cov_82_653956_g14_i0_p6_ORF_typecomplete_len403_score35_30_NODE_16_length_22882_cov_82_653956_g14_i02030421512
MRFAFTRAICRFGAKREKGTHVCFMNLLGVPSAPPSSNQGSAFRRLGKETKCKGYIASVYQGRLTVFASLTDTKGLCLAELQRPIISDATYDNGALERTFASIINVLAEVVALGQIELSQLCLVVIAYDSNNAFQYEWLHSPHTTGSCCLGALPPRLTSSKWLAHCDCAQDRTLLSNISSETAGRVYGCLETWLAWRFSAGKTLMSDPLRILNPEMTKRIIKHRPKTTVIKSWLNMCSISLPVVMTSDLRAMMIGMGVKQNSLGIDMRDACIIAVPIDISRKSGVKAVNDCLCAYDSNSIIPIRKLVVDGSIILDRLAALTHAYYDAALLDGWEPESQKNLFYIPPSENSVGGITGLTNETTLRDLLIAGLRAIAHTIGMHCIWGCVWDSWHTDNQSVIIRS